MVIEDIANKVMGQMSKQGLAGDVEAATGWMSEVEFKDNRLKQVRSTQSLVTSLRVIKAGKIGVAATNQGELASISGLIAKAAQVAAFGREANFVLPKPKKIYEPVGFDQRIFDLTEKTVIEWGQKILEETRQQEPEFRVAAMNFSWGSTSSVFANSNGISNSTNRSALAFGVELSKIQEGDFFQVDYGQEYARLEDDYQALVAKLIARVRQGKRIVTVKSGKYPVIFAPEAMASLIEYLLVAANGRSLNEKTSKFVGKIGEQLFDKRIGVVDDPTIDWGVGSYGLDDEGVVGRKTDLIRNGVVTGFYYDLNQAAKAGVNSTGSGVRSAFAQAEPSTSNVSVAGGQEKYDKLIKTIKEGLLVYGFLGAGQNDPHNGDFQLGVYLGYKIENGEVVGRVKDTAIAGNVFDLLKSNVLWLSVETERLGDLTVPFVCLDGVTVTVGQ